MMFRLYDKSIIWSFKYDFLGTYIDGVCVKVAIKYVNYTYR